MNYRRKLSRRVSKMLPFSEFYVESDIGLGSPEMSRERGVSALWSGQILGRCRKYIADVSRKYTPALVA